MKVVMRTMKAMKVTGVKAFQSQNKVILFVKKRECRSKAKGDS
jgi:hypothetical protein